MPVTPEPPPEPPPATIHAFLARPGPMRVIAHRGFSGVAPENTMAAFRRAIEVGAEMIEFDVLLSRDGEVVVIHDETLDRTTNGRGPVAARTLAELRALDAGAWFAAEFADERIPLLSEVLDLARGRILANIEIKTEAVGASAAGGIEEKVLRLVAARGMEDQVVISSFNPRALEHCRELSRTVVLAALYEDAIHRGMTPEAVCAGSGARGFNLAEDEVTAAVVRQAHEAGLYVSVYTVDDPSAMRRMAAMGVDALFTNRPDRMLALRGE